MWQIDSRIYPIAISNSKQVVKKYHVQKISTSQTRQFDLKDNTTFDRSKRN